MKTRIIALSIGLAFCFLPTVRGEEASSPKRQIRFEISSEVSSISKVQQKYEIPEYESRRSVTPACMARLLLIRDDREGFAGGDQDIMRRLSKMMITAKEWSDPQKLLLQEGAISVKNMMQHPYREIYLFAMSEADARAMAESLVSFLDDKAKKDLEDHKIYLEQKRRQAKEIEDAIPELESKHKSAEKEVFNSARVVGVGYEYIKYVNPAEEIVRELIPMLVKLDVEIKGLEAKVKALQILMNQGTEKTQETVHQMLIEQEVELAGARTRAQEMKNQQVHAMVLIEAHEKAGQLYTDILNRKKELEKLQKEMPSMEKTLANPPARMHPVEVLDNKVEIIPLAL